eukprot:5435423-Prymnesium_polylepis.1
MLAEPMADGTAWPFDPRPVINVCDRFELIGEMAQLLHAHGKQSHLRLYAQRLSPTKAPQVRRARDGGRGVQRQVGCAKAGGVRDGRRGVRWQAAACGGPRALRRGARGCACLPP